MGDSKHTPDQLFLLALARQAGATVYTNRHLPGEPAVSFGNESWARFVAVVMPRVNAHDGLVGALRRCREMVGHPDNVAFIDAALTKASAGAGGDAG